MEQNTDKNWLNNPATAVLLAVALLAGTVYMSMLSVNAYKEGEQIGRAPEERDTVTITGEGRVQAKPDLGRITVSIVTTGDVAQEVQEENVERFNTLTDALKESGIAEADLQTTGFNVYPLYDWVEGERIDRGFEVRQSIEVQIRDVDNAGEVIRVASQSGANEVSGLSFVVDEPEQYREEARRKALENAKQKADELSQVLGVKLGSIISFSESSSGVNPPMPFFREMAMDSSGGAVPQSAPAPDFEPGSEEVVVIATIVYEVEG